jgi:hypothetical protein
MLFTLKKIQILHKKILIIQLIALSAFSMTKAATLPGSTPAQDAKNVKAAAFETKSSAALTAISIQPIPTTFNSNQGHRRNFQKKIFGNMKLSPIHVDQQENALILNVVFEGEISFKVEAYPSDATYSLLYQILSPVHNLKSDHDLDEIMKRAVGDYWSIPCLFYKDKILKYCEALRTHALPEQALITCKATDFATLAERTKTI